MYVFLFPNRIEACLNLVHDTVDILGQVSILLSEDLLSDKTHQSEFHLEDTNTLHVQRTISCGQLNRKRR